METEAMTTTSKKNHIAESARPERRASKRLAADLLRFEKAFDRLERNRMGLGAIGPDSAPSDEKSPIADRDVKDYLNCLDEAIRQLAEEFAEDAALAKLAKQHAAGEAETGVESMIPIGDSDEIAAAAPLRGPACANFDARPCEGTCSPVYLSQVDTSVV
jgi:hypothetical protein